MEPSTSTASNQPGQVREHRKKYQELFDQGQELALRTQTENPVDIFDSVATILRQSESLIHGRTEDERMNNASEVNLNVQVIKMGHDLVGAALRKNESSQFCDIELATAILHFIGASGEIAGWEAIGNIGIPTIRMSKHSPCLLGSFEFQSTSVEKTRKERTRHQRPELAEVRRPEISQEVTQDQAEQRKIQTIGKQFKKIYDARGAPIPYFELITDPQDYMKTVETALQVTFLIRDGTVALETVNNELVVRPTKDSEKNQKRNEKVNQAILSFSPALWKNSIKKYRLKRPILAMDSGAKK